MEFFFPFLALLHFVELQSCKLLCFLQASLVLLYTVRLVRLLVFYWAPLNYSCLLLYNGTSSTSLQLSYLMHKEVSWAIWAFILIPFALSSLYFLLTSHFLLLFSLLYTLEVVSSADTWLQAMHLYHHLQTPSMKTNLSLYTVNKSFGIINNALVHSIQGHCCLATCIPDFLTIISALYPFSWSWYYSIWSIFHNIGNVIVWSSLSKPRV